MQTFAWLNIEFRRKNAGKKAAASREKEVKKKRKVEEPTAEGTDGDSNDGVGNEDNDEAEDEDEIGASDNWETRTVSLIRYLKWGYSTLLRLFSN